MSKATSAAGGSLPVGTRWSYAIGGLASGTFGTVPGMLLLPYLTDTLGIAAGLAGLLVFAPKAWDFVMNPLAGRISDRTTSPAGRRRPFVIKAGVALAVCFVLLFWGPTAPTWLAGAWVLVTFLAGATAYALFQVPYLAMAAEITDSYTERTRLMMWRVIVITLTILVSGGLAPMLVRMGEGADGYRVMALVMGALIVVGALWSWHGTRKAPMTRHEPAGGRLGEQLKLILTNPHARPLAGAFLLQAVATTLLLAGVVYAATNLIGDPESATPIFVAFVGPALVVAPLWERWGLKVGKKTGFMWSSALLAASFLGLLTAHSGNLTAVIAFSALLGIGYAGCQLFPLAMLPDVAAVDAATTGVNRIGTLTGVWAGIELLGFASGPAFYGLLLSLGGYVSSTAGGAAQPASALWAITLGVSVVPAILVLASMLVLRGYRLDEQLRVTP